MKLSAWLILFALVLLCLLGGMFRRNVLSLKTSIDPCGEPVPGVNRASPLLCGEKISLFEASAYDIAALPGISLKTARLIVEYIKEHPLVDRAALLALPGIGPKTLMRLNESFRYDTP